MRYHAVSCGVMQWAVTLMGPLLCTTSACNSVAVIKAFTVVLVLTLTIKRGSLMVIPMSQNTHELHYALVTDRGSVMVIPMSQTHRQTLLVQSDGSSGMGTLMSQNINELHCALVTDEGSGTVFSLLSAHKFEISNFWLGRSSLKSLLAP